MRIAQSSFRIPKNLLVTTPGGWGLKEKVGNEEVPFRLRFTVCPPTPEYRAFTDRRLKAAAPAIAARNMGSKEGFKALSRITRDRLSKSPEEHARDLQKVHDVTRGELLDGDSVVQLFADGREVPVPADELEGAFRVHLRGEPQAYVTDGAAGYKPDEIVEGEDFYELLQSDGEPLSHALVRFVAFWAGKAEKQREEAKQEVLGPLAPASGSSPGNGQSSTTLSTAEPTGATVSNIAAGSASESGTPAAAESARAATG